MSHFEREAASGRWGALYDPANPESHSFLARRDRVVELLGDVKGAHVLDLGCGTGALLGAGGMRDAAEYLGIDAAPAMVDAARRAVAELGLPSAFRVEIGDVLHLAAPAAAFDRVVAMGLLEYFDDPRALVRECVRVARPGATIVVTVPRRGSLNGAMLAATSPLRFVARKLAGAAPGIARREWRLAELRALFESEGCGFVAERVYNKLSLPYPFTRWTPRLAAAAARRAERRGPRFLATGCVAAFVATRSSATPR